MTWDGRYIASVYGQFSTKAALIPTPPKKSLAYLGEHKNYVLSKQVKDQMNRLEMFDLAIQIIEMTLRVYIMIIEMVQIQPF